MEEIMEKTMSIIIPSYNMELYLEKALESLLKDEKIINYLDIIIVNDGSKDNTSKIANYFYNRYPNVIKVIDKDNGNYGSCINEALKVCNGKYVKILDADDSFDATVFSKYIDLINYLINETEIPDLIITDYSRVDTVGIVVGTKTFSFPKNKVVQINEVTNFSAFSTVSHHAITYKTEILKSMNYLQTEGIPYTDQEWSTIPFLKINSFYYADIGSLYLYTVDRDGQSMGTEVFSRNINKTLIVLKNELKVYHDTILNSNDTNNNIVFEKICTFCGDIYYGYLISLFGNVENQEIVEFDNWLKENDFKIYNALNYQRRGRLRIRFIYSWRKNRIISLNKIYSLSRKLFNRN